MIKGSAMERLDRGSSRNTSHGAGKIMLNEKMPTVLLRELGKPVRCTIFPCTFIVAFYEPHTVRYRALDHASATYAYGINLNGERKEENKLIGHATSSILFLA